MTTRRCLHATPGYPTLLPLSLRSSAGHYAGTLRRCRVFWGLFTCCTASTLACANDKDAWSEAPLVERSDARSEDLEAGVVSDGVSGSPEPRPATPAEASFATPASGVDSDDISDPSGSAVEGDAPTTSPAPDGVLAIPARIEAEQFARFNETDAPMDANECGDGRVDMGLTDDADGKCYVGWTQGGEWLEYDVWSSAANVYSITLRLASGDPGRAVDVLVDGESVGSVNAPGNGWATFEDVVLEDVPLAAGSHTVRVMFTSGQTNFNYVVFDAHRPTPPSTTGDTASEAPSSADPGATSDRSEPDEGCASAIDGYELVWSDEFDYEGLPDPERWGYEVGGNGWGNGELQYYTDARRDNAHVQDGVLTITAIAEQYESNEYTSAKLNSSYGASNPGSWNEGIVRVRARLPAGLGTWPALWMMPNNCTEGWPTCGEIDLMEHVGYDEGKVHGTIHTDAFNHVEGTQRGHSVVVEDATSTFHEYALVWHADRLQWQVDGEAYYTIDKQPDWGFAEWPFNEKSWHLKVNLAVGGAWGGAEGVNRDDFPAQLEVDHVCVYQAAP